MQYRRLGKTDLELSTISMGTEHLVKKTREEVVSIVHRAIDYGINYYDVLFGYPDYRDNFGAAFKGLRSKVNIAAHLVTGESVENCKNSFYDFLTRLGTDYVDVLFVSCCDKADAYEKAIGPSGHLELAHKLRQQGKARLIAFSSHSVPVALKAVKSGLFDLLMFPVNPAFDVLPGESGTADLGHLWDHAYEASPDKLSHGVIPERKALYLECLRQQTGLIAMKPFASGWLFNPELAAGASPLQLIHYALSQPGVTCVVPGISSLEQVEEDMRYFNTSSDELDYSSLIINSRWNLQGTCMYCNHCLPCSAGIDVAEITRFVDTAGTAPSKELTARYKQLGVKASACTDCGICAERCPFGVIPSGNMKKAVELYEKNSDM